MRINVHLHLLTSLLDTRQYMYVNKLAQYFPEIFNAYIQCLHLVGFAEINVCQHQSYDLTLGRINIAGLTMWGGGGLVQMRCGSAERTNIETHGTEYVLNPNNNNNIYSNVFEHKYSKIVVNDSIQK